MLRRIAYSTPGDASVTTQKHGDLFCVVVRKLGVNDAWTNCELAAVGIV